MKQPFAVLTDDLLGDHAEKAFSGLIDTDNFEILVVQDHGVRKLVEDDLEKVCPQQAAGLWLIIGKRNSSGAQKTPPWQAQPKSGEPRAAENSRSWTKRRRFGRPPLGGI